MNFHRLLLTCSIVITIAAHSALAEEADWTDEQRAEQSVAVFVGTVDSVDLVRELNQHEQLSRAVFNVESASKARHLVGGDELIVYFDSPKSGDVNRRCPTYVALEPHQRATVYLRLRMLDGEWHAFIDMGSDVREAPPEGA